MAETRREGSVPDLPGSNMIRCTPTTTADVTRATFTIRETRAQPATGCRTAWALSTTGVAALGACA
eukprot:4652270-Pleurochrysis_carterae.AAC.1